MVNRVVFYLVLSTLFTLVGCDDEHFKPGIMHVQLERPAGYADLSLADIPVVLYCQSQGTTYTVLTNAQGQATFELTAGIYVLSVHRENQIDNTDYILSGSVPGILFAADGESLSQTVPLEVSTRGRLLISEFYFSGCLRADGKSQYYRDQYITLANNADEVIYLDGLCIGSVAPSTTINPSSWMLLTEMKELPLFLMCWEFPGTGTDYPLQPGEQQTVAINAINHTATEGGVPASLDLSKVAWGFWNPVLTESHISTGVKPLNMVWRSSGTSYIFTVTGPTAVVFRPQSDLRAWVADPDHLRKEPGKDISLAYLHIPADWVLDVVNTVSSIATIANTRVPAVMDASPGIAPATGSGIAMRRKYEPEGERLRWKDSNSTAEDFEKVQPSFKP